MAIQTDRAFTEQYIYTTMDVNCQEDILFRRPFIPYNGKRFFIKQTLGSGGIPGLYIYILLFSAEFWSEVRAIVWHEQHCLVAVSGSSVLVLNNRTVPSREPSVLYLGHGGRQYGMSCNACFRATRGRVPY